MIKHFSSVQSLSHVRLFATPWIAACQASLSITNSWKSLKLTSIDSVMPSSHLILCRPLLLLPPSPPSIRVFSNESTLRIMWPKYWSFSFIIPSNEHPGLISFRMDWLDLLAVQGTHKSLLTCMECKSWKSRNTWSTRQIWPLSMEWNRAKANRILPRERTAHSKHPLPTTQEKTLHMDITRWSTTNSDWLYSLQPKMEKLYTVSKNKTGSWLWLRPWTPYCQIQT